MTVGTAGCQGKLQQTATALFFLNTLFQCEGLTFAEMDNRARELGDTLLRTIIRRLYRVQR